MSTTYEPETRTLTTVQTVDQDSLDLLVKVATHGNRQLVVEDFPHIPLRDGGKLVVGHPEHVMVLADDLMDHGLMGPMEDTWRGYKPTKLGEQVVEAVQTAPRFSSAGELEKAVQALQWALQNALQGISDALDSVDNLETTRAGYEIDGTCIEVSIRIGDDELRERPEVETLISDALDLRAEFLSQRRDNSMSLFGEPGSWMFYQRWSL